VASPLRRGRRHARLPLRFLLKRGLRLKHASLSAKRCSLESAPVVLGRYSVASGDEKFNDALLTTSPNKTPQNLRRSIFRCHCRSTAAPTRPRVESRQIRAL